MYGYCAVPQCSTYTGYCSNIILIILKTTFLSKHIANSLDNDYQPEMTVITVRLCLTVSNYILEFIRPIRFNKLSNEVANVCNICFRIVDWQICMKVLVTLIKIPRCPKSIAPECWEAQIPLPTKSYFAKSDRSEVPLSSCLIWKIVEERQRVTKTRIRKSVCMFSSHFLARAFWRTIFV